MHSLRRRCQPLSTAWEVCSSATGMPVLGVVELVGEAHGHVVRHEPRPLAKDGLLEPVGVLRGVRTSHRESA